MGAHHADLAGDVYNRLTVIKYHSNDKFNRRVWICRCSCGQYILAADSAMKSNNTKSCGCLKIESSIKYNTTHNKSRTKIYRVWVGMKRRCLDKKHKYYIHYGGRGITVCDRWLNFENFYFNSNTGNRPAKIFYTL